ncbi:hypothetical protein Saro_2753 [Novosphingobium aromaticivorans DSM 12444]|uniref:Uncharacterized protein n=1 Tax=Novosphingobium aromaticivorans (strain ATCC 700278 / DSM 12444 / CCUG 56034 / CIP 105152 / NBRC 16084 / F199) TaxID=279238 RepID=Q2G4N4_NOVAD|nr:hypothetical protein Saro_2753 [Novosphingobium aromaticivorans DSM 12444]
MNSILVLAMIVPVTCVAWVLSDWYLHRSKRGRPTPYPDLRLSYPPSGPEILDRNLEIVRVAHLRLSVRNALHLSELVGCPTVSSHLAHALECLADCQVRKSED